MINLVSGSYAKVDVAGIMNGTIIASEDIYRENLTELIKQLDDNQYYIVVGKIFNIVKENPARLTGRHVEMLVEYTMKDMKKIQDRWMTGQYNYTMRKIIEILALTGEKTLPYIKQILIGNDIDKNAVALRVLDRIIMLNPGIKVDDMMPLIAKNLGNEAIGYFSEESNGTELGVNLVRLNGSYFAGSCLSIIPKQSISYLKAALCNDSEKVRGAAIFSLYLISKIRPEDINDEMCLLLIGNIKKTFIDVGPINIRSRDNIRSTRLFTEDIMVNLWSKFSPIILKLLKEKDQNALFALHIISDDNQNLISKEFIPYIKEFISENNDDGRHEAGSLLSKTKTDIQRSDPNNLIPTLVENIFSGDRSSDCAIAKYNDESVSLILENVGYAMPHIRYALMTKDYKVKIGVLYLLNKISMKDPQLISDDTIVLIVQNLFLQEDPKYAPFLCRHAYSTLKNLGERAIYFIEKYGPDQYPEKADVVRLINEIKNKIK